LSIILGIVSSVTALAVTQEEIDELKAQAEELEERMAAITEQKESVEYENMETLRQKSVLDEQSQLLADKIEITKQTIERYEELIVEKAQAVADAQAAEDYQLELFKTRLRAMEEGGVTTYISVIFEASSFADFLARIDFIGQVIKYDDQVYENLCTAREHTINAKGALELTKTEHEAQKVLLDEQKAELDRQIEEAAELIRQQEDTIESFSNYLDELEVAESDLEDLISQRVQEYEEQLERERLERERLEREAQEAANNSGGGYWGGTAYGTGTFIWPGPSSNIITSNFGGRTHPLYGYYTYHGGIDIGCSYGTNILASDSGIVITSEYHWSFGNFVMIDHGNGYTTLYGHMSQLLCSAG
ncbi:MAG: peptidoglycan DD-metalloendopeptidase family protein, partial [Oscillospiraceae bacterium]|nr:peptidoglycan DD-metalloendopeptidase family protein [Oscillospiraceae bacterium]